MDGSRCSGYYTDGYIPEGRDTVSMEMGSMGQVFIHIMEVVNDYDSNAQFHGTVVSLYNDQGGYYWAGTRSVV